MATTNDGEFNFGPDMFVQKLVNNEAVLDDPVTITKSFTIRDLAKGKSFYSFEDIFGDMCTLSQELAEWNLNAESLETKLDVTKYPVLIHKLTIRDLVIVDPRVIGKQKVGVTMALPFPDTFNPYTYRTASMVTEGELKDMFMFKPMRLTNNNINATTTEGAEETDTNVQVSESGNILQLTASGSCGCILSSCDPDTEAVVYDPVNKTYIPEEVRAEFTNVPYEEIVSRTVAFPFSVKELSNPGLVKVDQMSVMEEGRLVKRFMASVLGRPSELWFADAGPADASGARKVSMEQFCGKINQLLTYFTTCGPCFLNQGGIYIDFESDLIRLTSHVSFTVSLTFQPVVVNPDNGTIFDKTNAKMVNFFQQQDI